MVSSAASTRQPPAGGPKATVDLDSLLLELRQGDRDAFVRYFRTFRAPVHHAASLLLGDGAAAAAATRDALVAAFRRAILGEDAGDLEVLTYSCLLEACAAGGAPEGGEEARGRRRSRGDDRRRRFAAALAALDPRRREALVLHDVAGLDAARSAAVFGVTEEAAAALLFRAREEFRAGLHPGSAGEDCRQAEEATAGAVGRGLDEDELTRLRHHATYCRPCRKTMKEWAVPAGASAAGGLALVLVEPPLPQALAATPVFDEGTDVAAAGGLVAAGGLLFSAGRALRSRAAAWALAVLCLAVAAGVVVHAVGLQPLVLMQSVGPAIRLIVTPAGDGSVPAEARSVGQSARGAAGTIGISVATPPASAGVGSPVASPVPSASATPAERRTPTPAASVTPDASTAAGTGDSRSAAKAAKTAARTAARAARTAARLARANARSGAKAAKTGAKTARAGAKAAAKAARASGKAAAKATKSNAKAAAKANDKAASKSAKSNGKAAKSKSKAAKSNSKAAKSKSKAAKSKSHSRNSHASKKGG